MQSLGISVRTIGSIMVELKHCWRMKLRFAALAVQAWATAPKRPCTAIDDIFAVENFFLALLILDIIRSVQHTVP
jgi:hypothetical protein